MDIHEEEILTTEDNSYLWNRAIVRLCRFESYHSLSVAKLVDAPENFLLSTFVVILNYCGIEESSRPRQSHKLEIAGANPAPATQTDTYRSKKLKFIKEGRDAGR